MVLQFQIRGTQYGRAIIDAPVKSVAGTGPAGTLDLPDKGFVQDDLGCVDSGIEVPCLYSYK
jgi:hypothetical protein